MGNYNFDGTDDVLYSRDVIERIEELRNEIGENTAPDDFVLEREELAILEAFAGEGEGFADWHYGETFIADHYFETYAQELARDIGAIKGEEGWPLYCIDWERAADDLRQDYSQIELNGTAYWARA